MDELLDRVQRQHDEVIAARRREGRDAARREALAAACEAVAGWGPGSVVEPGWRRATEGDVAVQLAWAVRDLASAVAGCGLSGRLVEVASGGGAPAGQYALGLVVLAGQEGTREEVEQRVREAYSRPPVWREVRGWFRRLPEVLAHSEDADGTGRPRRKGGRKAAAGRSSVETAPAVDKGGGAGLPEEVTTAQAAEMLGVSKDTVLAYRTRGVLPYRDIAPPGSTKPGYLFPREAVLRMRTTYQTDQPVPRQQNETPRRRVKGERRYKHLNLGD